MNSNIRQCWTNSVGIKIGIPLLAIAWLMSPLNANALTSNWSVASGNWSDGLNWSPTGDPNNSSYSVIFNNGGSLTLDGDRTVGSYSQTGGTFTIGNGRTLALTSGGSLDGSGVMNLANTNMYQSAANVLFTNTNGTIQGYGNIGYIFGISLLNQASGVISANTAATSLSLNVTLTNNGLMRAQNGGQLLLTNGSPDVINNATIRSENGSNVSIQNRIIGGILDNTGSTGTLTLNGGKLRDVTIAAGSIVTNGNDGSLENTLINLGTLSTGASGSLMHIGIDTTLSGGGAIALINGTLTDGNNNRTLTNNDNVLRGYGTIGYNRTLSVINGTAGIIQADVSGQSLSLSGSGTFTNNGVMRAMNGGQLLFANGSPDVINNATIRSENGSNVSIQNRIVGGTLDNTGSTGTLTLNGGKLRDVTIAAGSIITNGNDGSLENTLINLGTLSTGASSSLMHIGIDTTLSGGGAIALVNGTLTDGNNNRTLSNNDNVLRGYGTIGYNRTLSVINGTAGIIQADVSGQTLFLQGSGTFTNNGLMRAMNGCQLYFANGSAGVTNTGGVIEALPGSAISANSIIFTQSAGTIIVDGTMNIPSGVDLNGGQMIGNGTFNGPIRNNATIAPGHPVGRLNVSGSMQLNPTSLLSFEIGGLIPATQYDVLNKTSSDVLTLGGSLAVRLTNGFTPAPSDVFTIVTTLNTLAGSFSNVASGQRLQTEDGSGSFIVTQSGPNVILSNFEPAVTSTPTPTPIPTGTPTPTSTAIPTGTPTPAPTLTPTPINISGAISYCSNPVPGPVPNVTLTLTGGATTSAATDSSGNYELSSLEAGGSYTVTPTKSGLTPGSSEIDTMDAMAAQRHFLNIAPIQPGCPMTASDVNGDIAVNTLDVVAIQRFFLGVTTGIANVGKYQFSPASRAYPGMANDQAGQNYEALVLGDVDFEFVHRSSGTSQSGAGDGLIAREVPTTVATLSLPNVAVDTSVTYFIVQVTTSPINAGDDLVGFQGDFTFDERAVTFQSDPVQKAGLTGGNWNVSGNILPGVGPLRTLRISAFSNDFTSLSGSGTLFELRMTRVSKATQSTQLIWAVPPNQFIFIDADLKPQKPDYAVSGSVTKLR